MGRKKSPIDTFHKMITFKAPIFDKYFVPYMEENEISSVSIGLERLMIDYHNLKNKRK